jgi:hypothetical protein
VMWGEPLASSRLRLPIPLVATPASRRKNVCGVAARRDGARRTASAKGSDAPRSGDQPALDRSRGARVGRLAGDVAVQLEPKHADVSPASGAVLMSEGLPPGLGGAGENPERLLGSGWGR